MSLNSGRWIEITPSQFPWEQEALAFVRERLPDHDPYRAWSSFEFIASDGSINEVDLLVLTPKGFFLVEIKSRPGNVDGDASAWTWSHDGRRFTDDNPLILADRKAKKLVGLLRQTRAMKKVRMPFLQARVFLSGKDNRVRLPDHVGTAVHTRDRDTPEDRNTGRGIVDALTRWTAENAPRLRVDSPIAKALTRAMEEAGIRQSQRARKVGDYKLNELLYEGPTYQDWAATHVALEKGRARVRIYVVEPGASEEARASIVKAAKREYAILNGINHPSILRARAYTEHERGPALVYDYLPGSQRLDHYLSERGERLSASNRLDLIREIAEAVRYAHGKRLFHRALSPQNILVLDPQAATPHIQVFNWQTAAREPAGSRDTSLGYSTTSHVANFIEEASAVYMAPEALAERGDAGEQADVFSLGALAYHLFAGAAPARTFYELGEKLREGKGLQISSVLDGVAESLQYLIQFSTYPQVTGRLDSVVDFLDELEKSEDEITTPELKEGVVTDPTLAKQEDVLADGLVVKKRLGKGASSLALLVDNQGKEQVLKVALEPEDNSRLKAEAEVLRKLRRHQFIVQLHDERDYQGRVGILMDRAGDKTLAQRLREEGRMHLELLERFGEDLPQVVDWLEQEGVPHRDIKPENLGVALMGKSEQLHLVLFDFSLADTPAENVRAGTVPYLDPFLALRKPPRWDTYAERFAAAVTQYQMATGALPTWGDGQSDPAVIDEEATLDTAAFDATLRQPMTAFFEKALGRANLRTVRDLIHYPLAQIRRLRGVGSKTRRELAECLEKLAERFPEAAAEPKQLPAEEVEAPASADEAPSIDVIANLLVPAGRTKESKASARAVEHLLGLSSEAAHESAGELAAGSWPSQSEVARGLAVDPGTVSRAVASARKRWLKTPAMTGLREDIAALLENQGGVMTGTELAEALLSSRGSVQSEPVRTSQAFAVLRSAVETERDRAAPRWIVRRAEYGGQILLARDELADDGTASIDGERLADYAEALGKCADELAREDPLRPPGRVLESLQAIEAPTGTAPAANRLLQLAAATSRNAALSRRLELYPRGMPAARALKLALGALAGAKELTPQQVRERVAGRYPEAEPLPDRPDLDALLEDAGSELKWKADAAGGKGAYVSPLREFTTVLSATALTRVSSVARRFEEVPADKVEIDQFEQLLRYSVENEGFLALVVSPARAALAEQILVSQFPLEVRSLDGLLIRHMKAFTAEKRVDWRMVLRADAVPAVERSASRDWGNLQRVVRSALPRVKVELAESPRHVLLTNPGLLARYGQIDLLGELMQSTGRPGGPPGLWILIPSDGQQQKPTLDGHPVPVFTSAQWARIPELWLAAHQPTAAQAS